MTVIGTPVVGGSPLIDVTTAARVKQAIGGEMPTDTSFDTQIGEMIAAASKAFEMHMARKITLATYAEIFTVEPGQMVFWLLGYPITSITDVRYDWDRAFPDSTIIDAADYTTDPTTGKLAVDRFALTPGHQLLKVTYLGGMAPDTNTFVSDYADLAEAADMQIAFWFNRWRSLGTDGGSGATGGSSSYSDESLLPEVRRRLSLHRKMGYPM